MSGLLQQLQGHLAQGGAVMPPLLFGAMLLWYALGYRALTLRRGSRLGLAALIRRCRGGELDRPRGLIDRAVVRAVAIAERRPRALRGQLDDALADFELELGRYARLASAIVVVAPLAGLLGTVSGMIETFESLGEGALYSQSGGIAGGIAEALITTQAGLAVAIPGMLVGRLLRRRQRLLAAELEQLKHLLCGGGAAA